VLEALLGFRAKIEKANNDGWTPLHAATFHGQLKCMEALMDEKANVNAQDNLGCTPLIFAASSPKLYLLDFVSRSDRRKRQRVRVDAFNEQTVLLESQKSGGKSKKGKNKDAPSQIQHMDPKTVWKFYPNRIELIVLNLLLSHSAIRVDAPDKKRRTPLIYAARYGHLHALSRLLYAKANIRVTDTDGRTALFHAACNEHIDIVDMLLRAGGSVNTQDQLFQTPLHGALEAGDENMVNLLLKADASVQAYDCEGRTPIMMAMDQHNRRLFSAIVEHGCSLDVLDKRGWNVVIYAIERGMLGEVMPLLLRLGERVQPIIRAPDPQGRNAIHHAAQMHSLQEAQESLEKILRLDHRAAELGDCNGNTAFHMVAELGRLEAMRMLIDQMPSADFLNHRDETPLHYAAHSGHLACVVALVHDRGRGPACNAAAVDGAGWSVLMHACASGHLDLVNLLLQNRDGSHQDLELPPLDVNHCDGEGLHALSIAAREGHWQLLPSLVLAGANTAGKDSDGYTALHWAVVEDEPLAASCLLDLGADPDAVDARCWTPLMHAAANGCDETARVLLDARANIEARNWDGDTALQICMRRKDRPEQVQITKDILTDGMLDLDCQPRGCVAAQGHFMVSVLDASDLYLEGKVGEVNAYVCLQLRTQDRAITHVAFSSCTLQNPFPEWHEVFRFDTEKLDPSACLVAWVIAAPGSSAEEVVESAERGLSEDELRRFKMEEQMAGQAVNRTRPEFTTSMQHSFKRLMRRAELAEDLEVDKLRKLAMAQTQGSAPTSDLLILRPNQKDAVPLEERRWNEVANLRALLKRSGCDIDEPLVPRSHLPLGCVVVRFRHLRTAVWSAEPVEIDRTLRLSCRGTLRLEIDFRPRFFIAEQNARNAKSTAEEEAIYEVRPPDPLAELESDEEADGDQAESLVQAQPIRAVTVDEALAAASGEKHLSDPETLFKRFVQVTHWSRKVLEAQQRLGPSSASGSEQAPQGFLVVRKVKQYIQQYRAARELEDMRQQIMDRPVGTALAPPRAATKDRTVQPAAPPPQPAQAPVPKLPKLQAEPWLEELLEGSRFF